MDQDKGLPWEVFRLTSTLLPHLDRLFETSMLTPTSLLVLSHLKHFGKDYSPKRKILLKNEVLDLLKRIYGYSAAAATMIVKNLHNGGLVDIESLTADKKELYLGERRGYKDAIVLTKRGADELDNFNRNLNRLFDEITGDMPRMKLKALTAALAYFSRYAFEKLEKRNRQE
jgi:DNA-binding MarR family transcriptional regulator